MDFEALQKFAVTAEPTRPASPVLNIDPRWLQKFQTKVTEIAKDEALIFAFPERANEVLLDLERRGLLESEPLPYHEPLAKAGLFFLSPKTGGQGWHLAIGSIREAHALLCSEAKLASCPTLVSSGKSRLVHYYPEGLAPASRETYFEFDLGGISTLNVIRLKQALDFFATDKVLNKSCNRAALWAKADKHWAHERAEKNIQKLLIIALQMKFQEGLVLEEITVPSGRTDVVIEEKRESSIVRYLLELKAVRKFGSKGGDYSPQAQLDHCTDGIIQARTNGEDLKADNSFLCAYDLRPDPDTVLRTTVEAKARLLDIEVGWYPVAVSSKAGRKARLASSKP
jgi:hypothetical protein